MLIQVGLGEFFAAKLRSGVLYEIYSQTGNQDAGARGLALYQKARTSWANMAQRAAKVYQSDISYGRIKMRRGNWSDRLPEIDKDIAAMELKLQNAAANASDSSGAAREVRAALAKPSRPIVQCEHVPPRAFKPGEPVPLTLKISSSSGQAPDAVELHYRHVDQGERWKRMNTTASGDAYSATISGEYTASPFALQYYFVLSRGKDTAWMFPGFYATLSNQPYWAIQQKG